MRKNFITSASIILTAFLLFSGCQKQINEPSPSETADTDQQIQSRNGHDDNNCRLVHIDFGGGDYYRFRYNNEGLAKSWLIAGEGYSTEHQIKYDRRNRISKTHIIYDGGTIDYTFYHNGDLVTRATGYDGATHELYADIFYSYNRKGEMTRIDDIVNDYHTAFFYDRNGNNNKSYFYIGTDLYLAYFFEFKISNRNPYLAVPGVSFGFPFYVLPLWDDSWESRDSIVLYENNIPTLLVDYDPARTRMHTGRNNYLTSARYYDRVTESPVINTMIYENCGRRHDGDHDDNDRISTPSSNKSTVSTNAGKKLRQVFIGSVKNIKAHLNELRNQFRK